MSISSGATRKAGPYAGTGSTTAFPFYFKVFTSADVLVVQTDTSGNQTTLTLTTNYTVALNADQDNNPGGTVTCLVAPPSGYTLTIGSQVAQTQTTVLTNSGGFYPTVINNALDKLTILVQQLAEVLGRALTLPFSSSGVSTTLPVPVANTIIGWNSTATGFTNRSVTDLVTTAAYSSWNAQLFNGTGAQVNYTLSAAPGQIGNCDVSISGVTQRPNVDYTLAGTVVTFTTAPPSGTNNVLIRYGQALAALSDSNVNSLNVATTLGVGGAATLSSTLAVTGNTAVGGTLGVTGVATFNNNVVFGSGLTIPQNCTQSQLLALLSASVEPFRNVVINGDMSVDQRNGGAAQTITAGAALAYTLDRHYAYCTGANVTTQQVTGSDARSRLRFTGAASVTGIGLGHRVEARNSRHLAGQTATLSVKASSSSLTTLNWAIYYASSTDTFGTLASPTRTSIASGSFTINTTEATYSTQIAIPGAATTGIEIVLTGGAMGAATTLTLGDLQLERGAIATANIQPEMVDALLQLQRCQYYAQQVVGPNSNCTTSGAPVSSVSVHYVTPFGVPMRSAPQLVVLTSGSIILNSGSNNSSTGAPSLNASSQKGIWWVVSGYTSMTPGYYGVLSNASTAVIMASAEL